MTKKEPKIEAIYPLSFLQQGLLFHHLSSQDDQGFLMVECFIEGNIDIEKLKFAWQSVTKRHEVLRTSVHWKNVTKPIQVVRPEKEINWLHLDWKNLSKEDFEKKLKNFKAEKSKIGSNFEKNPLSNITLIEINKHSYCFLWECHHLLLDGWSSAIILRDAFKFYDGLYVNKKTNLPSIPNQKNYNNWLKNIPLDDAKKFWATVFKDFNKPLLFQENNHLNSKKPKSYKFNFSEQKSSDLKNLAKKYKVTLNTLFQGIWALTLAKCFDSNDVTFGNTVSGRSLAFPNIELMAGMFTNVIPVRSKFILSNSLESYLQNIQKQQQEARNYENSKINQIVSWANLPEDKPLFDSLFVFENFPWKDIIAGNIIVKKFSSGITSTYPITAIFKIEQCLQFEIVVNNDIFEKHIIDWFLNSVPEICNYILLNREVNLIDILNNLTSLPKEFRQQRQLRKKISENTSKIKEASYTAPINATELTLVEIWEQVFGVNLISTSDSFFSLGGKSLLSVKMFSLIEQKLNVKLSPTVLLEHPTIKELAKIITKKDNKNQTSWKYVVPIKTKGKKAPLFCIHAGGGHIFFYKELADAIDTERPVYAIQPMGIFGEKNKHQSIEEMSKDYADEISLVQPEGTLNIIVYCFSTAVGIEMAAHLKSKGRKTHLIVADTIAEHRLLLNKKRLAIRVSAFLKRFFSNPFRALNEMIGYRIYFYLQPIKIKIFGNEAEKNTEQMRLHLVDLFNAYQWKTKVENVSIVLTKKVDERYNKEIERSWKPLVEKEIKVETCNGNHKTFFENPDVVYTANAIETIIAKN